MDAEETKFVEDWQKWAAAEARTDAKPDTVVRDMRGYVVRGE
jgi:hypothetical protein